MKRLVALLFMIVLPLISQVRTGPPIPKGEEGEEGLSPYFLVQGDPKIERFPLLETKTDIQIAGMIAEIELTQVYKNDGKQTIEAVYVFPLGTKSAIHAMRMKIGSRIIDADIEETAKAQKIYQDAKNEGKVASLLEQKRPNVFQMKVANIMPGDVVKVIVKYTEILVPEKGTYEFVFPTVVGPRFTGESKKEDLKGKDSWVASPYLHQGEEPPYRFDIKVNIQSGIPLAKVWVPTHKVDVKKRRNSAIITLSSKEKNGGNRDFILRYNLQGRKIETGLLLYPGKDEKFFLMMLEPPKSVNMKMVPPREYIFIVDVSGSMHGFPLDVSKALIRKIIGNLRGKDYFNVLFFAGGSQVLSEQPLQATKKNKEKAIDLVMSQSGGGGTRILSALKRALALKKKKGMSRIVVIATDGYVSVEKEVFDLMRDNLGEANFFAFGIGSSVNRYLIEGMARVGKGEPFIVTSQKEAEKIAAKFMNYVKHPLLTDIGVSFSGFDAYEVEPISIPDLFAERPLILFGKYKNAKGNIIVKGKTAKGTYKRTLAVKSGLEDGNNVALKFLWAREKIARLADYGRVGVEVREEVTELGLKYHLMTEYTSFVAVDKIVRETGEVVTVKQPLPLPQGVSDYAVGGTGASRGYYKAAPSSAPIMMEKVAAGEDLEDKRALRMIYVAGGRFPKGISLNSVEKTIQSQIGKELENLFKKWELKSLTVSLELANGKVIKAKIKKYDAKKMSKKELEKLFKKLEFPTSIQGKIELNLKYTL